MMRLNKRNNKNDRHKELINLITPEQLQDLIKKKKCKLDIVYEFLLSMLPQDKKIIAPSWDGRKGWTTILVTKYDENREIELTSTLQHKFPLHIILARVVWRKSYQVLYSLGKRMRSLYFPHNYWLIRMYCLFAKAGKEHPENYIKKYLAKNITLYSSENKNSEKTLIICFSDRSQSMLMPLPVFLQHFDTKHTDILLVKCPDQKLGFRKGIEGVADNIETLIDTIASLIEEREYSRKVAIGTSAGGLPALVCALRLKLSSVLSVGGNRQSDKKWIEITGMSVADLVRRNLPDPSDLPEIYLAYGSGVSNDYDAALSHAEVIPAKVIKIGEDEDHVPHPALLSLVNSGSLQSFLNDTVMSD